MFVTHIFICTRLFPFLRIDDLAKECYCDILLPCNPMRSYAILGFFLQAKCLRMLLEAHTMLHLRFC